MSHFIELIKSCIPHISTQRELDEAYLNASVDVFDVERRMEEIDRRQSSVPWYTPTPFVNVH